jgi:endoglycosylceramidase
VPRRALLACVVLLALAPSVFGASHLFRTRIQRDGLWLRDGKGRVVILRGVNYSGLEFGNFFGRPNGPAEEDFAQMASWGVNVVRLPIAWHYLEPAPGVFDEEHLETQVDPIIRFARKYDIGIVLELHQFQWSPCFGGNGVPAWTCAGYPPGAVAQAMHDFWSGAPAPDGRRLIDHLLDVWARLARRYGRRPIVVGFNFLNEPLDPLNFGGFEHDALYPFYREAVTAVRGARAKPMIVLDPPVLRNLGVRAHPEDVGDLDLLYAPHLYTTTFGLPDRKYTGDRAAVDRDYAQAAVEAAEQGAVLWVGEYGGNTNVDGGFLAATELFLRHQLEEQEERLVGSAFWAYFPTDNTFSLVDATGAEKGELVNLLARPYPMVTAGLPQELHWDPDTREFLFRFIEDPVRRVPDPTMIFVPAARHYPGGFVVETSPGDEATFDATRSQLVVRRNRALGEHVVRLCPAP